MAMHKLESSTGLGTGSMALVKGFQIIIILANQDWDRLKLAQKLAMEQGVEDLIEVRLVEILLLGSLQSDFQSYVSNAASEGTASAMMARINTAKADTTCCPMS